MILAQRFFSDPDMGAPEPDPEGSGFWVDGSGYCKAVWSEGCLVEGVQNPVTGAWDDLAFTPIVPGSNHVQFKIAGRLLPLAKDLPYTVHEILAVHFSPASPTPGP